MKTISFFSGIGLLDQGILDAGNEILLQVEKDEPALKVLKKAFPDIKKHCDIISLEPSLLKYFGIEYQDCAFFGGCPCQQHSYANPSRSLKTSSELLEKLVYLCETCKPRFLLIENVHGFVSDRNGLIWLADNMEELGYTCHAVEFPAKLLCAPHERMRVFCLFCRDSIVVANKKQKTYIENFENQVINMKIFKGIWHDRDSKNPEIQQGKIVKGKIPKYVENSLKMIGNAVVYDVALFIGTSLKFFNDYFYDSAEGQKLQKIQDHDTSYKDIGSLWQNLCVKSLTYNAKKIGFEPNKKPVNPSNKYHVITVNAKCDEDKNYQTPLASDGHFKSNEYTKIYNKEFSFDGSEKIYVNPIFNAWLMGMSACPEISKAVCEVSGMPLETLKPLFDDIC